MRKILIALLELGIQYPYVAKQISAWCQKNGTKEVELGFGKAYMLSTGEILQVRDNQVFFRGETVRSGFFDWKEAKQILAI